MSVSYPNFVDDFREFSLADTGLPDGAIIYQSDSLQRENYHVVAVVGSGSVHVEVTLNDLDWFPTAVQLIDDISVNSRSTDIHHGQMGVIIGKFLKLRIIKDGSVSVHGFHGWV